MLSTHFEERTIQTQGHRRANDNKNMGNRNKAVPISPDLQLERWNSCAARSSSGCRVLPTKPPSVGKMCNPRAPWKTASQEDSNTYFQLSRVPGNSGEGCPETPPKPATRKFSPFTPNSRPYCTVLSPPLCFLYSSQCGLLSSTVIKRCDEADMVLWLCILI